MYNNCFGGFTLSDEAIDEYNKRNPAKPIDSSSEIDRADTSMIQICIELGLKASSGRRSSIQLAEIPKKYASYYKINEYDGAEGVSIDVNSYKLDNIKIIVEDNNNNSSNEDKIDLIKQLLDEPDTEFLF
jgi:hypothetical protein